MSIARLVKPGGALLALLAVACGLPTEGPTLDIALMTPAGRSISTGSTMSAEEVTVPTNRERDRGACCCSVTGSATNRGTTTLLVKLSFDASSPAQADPLGRAIQFIERLEPDETREIDARGILVRCDEIETVTLTEVDLRAFVFEAPE
ncbi:MAG: hypothetical protein ACOC5E_01050 [Acidobacteriota bacterium]